MKRVFYVSFAAMFFLAAEMSACDSLTIVPAASAVSIASVSCQPAQLVPVQTLAYVQPTIAVRQIEIQQIQQVQYARTFAIQERVAVQRRRIFDAAACVPVGIRVQPVGIRARLQARFQGRFQGGGIFRRR